MNFLSDLLESNVPFFPFGHFEGVEEAKDLFDLLIVFFDVISSYFEVNMDLFYHVCSYYLVLD